MGIRRQAILPASRLDFEEERPHGSHSGHSKPHECIFGLLSSTKSPCQTLYPEGNAREMVSDIRLVLDWTARNAATYGGSRDSIYIMGHGSGAHLSLLTIVQEAVVRSRDAYWLSTFSKSKSLPEDAYSSDEDSPTSRRNHPPSHREGEIEISAGIRRLEIWGGEAVEIPRIKGMILMAGVSDVIKHIRAEFKNGIEQISPLRRALGPSHAACLMASPSHLIYGAKQVSCI